MSYPDTRIPIHRNRTDEDRLVKESLERLKSYKDKPMVAFPETDFPVPLVAVLKELLRVKQLPADYFGATMVTVAASLIGTSVGADNYGQKQVPCLFTVLVGRSSIGKTAAMNAVTKKLKVYEKAYEKKYRQMLGEQEEDDRAEVVRKQLMLHDTTTEAAVRAMKANPRGMILIRPEIKGFLESLGAYKAGGAGKDADFWKEVWDNHTHIVNRVGGGPAVFIENPFTCILGGIPPGVVKKFGDRSQTIDGFLARFLFAHPYRPKKMLKPRLKLNDDIMSNWRYCMDFLKTFPMMPEPDNWDDDSLVTTFLPLDDDAAELYDQYGQRICDECNATEDEVIDSILGKMQDYALRFSIVFELMYRAFEREGVERFEFKDLKVGPEEMDEVRNEWKIRGKSMANAINLAKYFEGTAKRIAEKISSPTGSYSHKVQKWYKALPHPDEFSSKVAVETGKNLGMSRSNVFNQLGDEALFKSWGKSRNKTYEKLWVE